MAAHLGLGTVQFGVPYGVANDCRLMSEDIVETILETAASLGIEQLDTAAAYGVAEARLGRLALTGFRIVSKAPPLQTAGSLLSLYAQEIEQHFANSLKQLGTEQLDGYLLHNADDLAGEGGEAIFEQLRELRASGKVRNIGTSIYDRSQIDQLEDKFGKDGFDIVQLPGNVFDQRLVADGTIADLANRGVRVHLRSAFLQGVLLMQPDALPPHFARHSQALAAWHAAVVRSGHTPLSAALAFARDIAGVECVLVGAVSPDQLTQTAQAFAVSDPFDATGLASDALDLIDPRQWTPA